MQLPLVKIISGTVLVFSTIVNKVRMSYYSGDTGRWAFNIILSLISCYYFETIQ